MIVNTTSQVGLEVVNNYLDCPLAPSDAIVQKVSLPFANRVISIMPPVPRRIGWKDDETSVFYIKFKTEEGRDEVSQGNRKIM